MAGALLSLGLAAGCVGIGGETITLKHDDLREPPVRYSENLAMRREAEDLREDRSRIGRATITVFAITSGSVQTRSAVTEEVIREVQTALETVGYRVQTVSVPEALPGDTPTVVVSIRDFYFRNYNWLWPIVPTWGGVEIGLTLKSTSGRVLFEKSFEASGNSFCLLGNCAFTNATKEALTEVLNDIIEATATDEFRRALTM